MRTTLRSGSHVVKNQKNSGKRLRQACRGIVPNLSGLEPLEDRMLLSVPAGWQNLDLGTTATTGSNPAFAGSTTYNGSQSGDQITDAPITVRGGGSDIWDNADHFQYAYNTTKLEGNGSITVNVDSLVDSSNPSATLDAWAKAGIVLRAVNPGVNPATGQPDAAYAGQLDYANANVSLFGTALVGTTPNGGGLSMQWRTSEGGGSANYAIDGKTGYDATIDANPIPEVIRLERQDNTFIASYAKKTPILQLSFNGYMGTASFSIDANHNLTLTSNDVYAGSFNQTFQAAQYATVNDLASAIITAASASGWYATAYYDSSYAYYPTSQLPQTGSTSVVYGSPVDVSKLEWTELSRQTLAMPNSLYVGLGVTAHDNTKMATGTFSNIDIERTQTSVAPTAPGSLTVAGLAAGPYGSGLGHDLKIDWRDNSANETGYILERATEPFNAANPSASAGYTEISLPADSTTYTDADVTVGTHYYYRVVAVNATGQSTPSNTNDATSGQINAVTARYWNSQMTFTGTPAWMGYEPTVAKYWGNGVSPENGVTPLDMSARFTGRFRLPAAPDGLPTGGTWTVISRTDDYGRLYVNSQLADNDWATHGLQDPPTINPITYQPNTWYNFQLDMVQAGGGAGVELVRIYNYTDGQGQAQSFREIIPQADLLADMDAPLKATNISANNNINTQVDVTWTDASISELNYILQRSTDGTTWMNLATLAPSTSSYSDMQVVNSTTYYYRVQGMNYDGQTTSDVATVTTGSNVSGAGLLGQYYNGFNPGNPTAKTLAATRFDSQINFNFDANTNNDRPAGFDHDNEEVIWEGYITPTITDTYTFGASSDDGIRVFVNGKLMTNGWVDRGVPADATTPDDISNDGGNYGVGGTVQLTAGQRYPIQVAFYQGGGGAAALVYWKGDSATSGAWQLIPAGSFVGPDSLPAATTDLASSNVYATTATLRWTNKAINEDSTRVQLSTDGGATWNDYTSYRIDDGNKGGSPSVIQNTNGASTAMTLNLYGLAAATSYKARVLDSNFKGDSVSNVVSFTTIQGKNGSLSIQQDASTGDTSLSSEGTLDWVMYGFNGDANATVRNATNRGIISNYSVIGGATVTAVTDAGKTFTWNNGLSAAAADVTQPTDPISPFPTTVNGVAAWPAAENPNNAIDNNTGSKWLTFAKYNTGIIVTPASGASVVTALRLTSGNDAPERDPASYLLYGSNNYDAANPNAATWSLISAGAIPAFSGRVATQDVGFQNSASYTTYKVIFPTVANDQAANSMQISEIQFLQDSNAVVASAPAGVQVSGDGNGFHLTVKSGVGTRTVKLYVAADNTIAKLTGNVTDASAANVVDTTLDATGGHKVAVYTIKFNTDPTIPNQYLNLDFVAQGGGSVTLLAADVVDDVTPAPATDIRADIVGKNAVTLNWTDNDRSELGFKVERSDDNGTTWNSLVTLGANTVAYRDANVQPGKTYQYRVTSFNGAGNAAPSNVLTVTTQTLASGWSDSDIGSGGDPKIPGDAWTDSNNVTTIRGSGGDIWGHNDRFHYVYQQTNSTSFAITARVLNMSITNGWTKVGPMIRTTLSNVSDYYMAMNTGGNGRSFQGYENGANFSDVATGGGFVQNYWLRLVYNNGQVTAYASPDGVTFTQLGNPHTVTATGPLYVGLAVDTSDVNTINTARFDNISFVDFTTQAPIAPVLTGTSGAGTAHLTWNEVPGATGYTVYRNGQAVGNGYPGWTVFDDAGLIPGQTYSYQVSADGVGSTRSNTVQLLSKSQVGTGLSATYYAMGSGGQNFNGFSSTMDWASQGFTDPSMFHQKWADNANPLPALANFPGNNWSTVWEGYVMPDFTGTYTFSSMSDDGTRIYLDAKDGQGLQLIENNWRAQGYGASLRSSAPIQLQAGVKYPIRVEYMQGGGGEEVGVLWSSNTIAQQYIPVSNLFPSDQAPTAPANLKVSAGSTSVTVGFQDTATNEDAVRLEYSSDGGATWQPFDPAGNNGWFGKVVNPAGQTIYNYATLSNLTPGASYSFRAVAINGAAVAGVASAPVTVTLPAVADNGTQAATPVNVQVLPGMARANTIIWGNDSAIATGFKVQRSTDGGTTWVDAGTTGATATSFRDTSLTPSTSYVYRVIAQNSAGTDSAPSAATAPVTTQALPSDWNVVDAIGGVPAGQTYNSQMLGDAGYDAATGTWTMRTSGADIWNNQDQEQYVYQDLHGDGTIIARVTAQQFTDGWAKTGLQIRETTDAGSKQVGIILSAGNGLQMTWRPVADQGSSSVTSNLALDQVTPNVWLRLQRLGDVFTGWWSEDGQTWNQLFNPISVSMGADVKIGMAATSHNTGLLGYEAFDNVQVLTAPVVTKTMTPTNPMADAGDGVVRLGWTGGYPGATYTIKRGTASGAETVLATGVTATNYADTTAVNGTKYYYVITATGGIATESDPSVEVSATPAAWAFDNGFSATNLSLNGSASIVPTGKLRVTPNTFSQAGSAWTVANINGFTTSFDFQMSGSTGPADGLVFAIQGVNHTSLGGTGGSAGWVGIGNSFGLFFKNYGSSQVGVFKNGDTGTNGTIKALQTTGTVNIRDWNVMHVVVSYDDQAKTLTYTITDKNTLDTFSDTVSVDLPALVGGNAAFIGFTAGTGGSTSAQDVLNWQFQNASAQPTFDGTLTGTAGNDTYVIDSDGTNYTVTVNGQAFAPVAVADWSNVSFGGVAGGNDTLKLTGSAAVTLTNTATLAGLDIASGAKLSLSSGGDKVLVVNAASPAAVNVAGTLDLADNDAIIQTASPADRDALLATLSGLIGAARNGGAWNHAGITSSAAQTDSSGLTGLAISGGAGLPAWTGQSFDANSVLIKYTFNGDADLNGMLDGSDYFFIDKGYLARNMPNPPSGYHNGDFDLNGIIDGSDYFLIDKAFLAQKIHVPPAPLAAVAAPQTSVFSAKPIATAKAVTKLAAVKKHAHKAAHHHSK